MNRTEMEAALTAALRRIAPDVDVADIDRDADLREEFDIDSMDFLNLVTALGKQFSLPMPEEDTPRLSTFEGVLDYLEEKVK